MGTYGEEKFGGIIPVMEPRNLPPGGAQIANNVKIFSGAIRTWMEPADVTPAVVLFPGVKKSLFLYQNKNWLNWITDVDCVHSPVGNDAFGRVYWTDGVYPKMSVAGVVNSSPPYPSASYMLGIPVPINSPYAIVNGQPQPDQTYAEDRAYVYTYVSAYGEEGPPYYASNEITWYPASSIPTTTIITGAVTKGTFQTGEEIIQATSLATAQLNDTVAAFGPMTVTMGTGTPDATHIWTGQVSKATFTPNATPATAGGVPAVDNTVTLTGLAQPPAGNWNIIYINIYRTNTGSSSTDFQFVAQIPVTQTTYTDNTPNSSLGSVMQSTLWDAPPADLQGLMIHPCGCMVGFSGNIVCFSEEFLPHAWPVQYQLALEYPIVSMGMFGTSIVVTTEGTPYLILGSAPGQMSGEKISIGQACVSKRSTVAMSAGIAYADIFQSGVMYASADGIVMVGTGQMDVVTRDLMSKDEWQAFNPSSMQAVLYQGCYLAFYDTGTTSGALLYDPKKHTLITFDPYSTAGFSDIFTDTLYFVSPDQTTIQQWDGGSVPLPYTWKSKEYFQPHPQNIAACQIVADDYSDLTLTLYADGSQVYQGAVTSMDAFKLPGGFMAHRYEFQLSGTSYGVKQVILANHMYEVAKA